MSARLLKCYGYCDQKYPADQLVKYKNANHCHVCYDRKTKEVKDRENLYNVIKEVFELKFPTGMMLRQIKEYREDRGYTYKNIAFTIDYMVKRKGLKLQTKYGIALVPHYYDEMITYYKDLKEKRENTVLTNNGPKRITIKNVFEPEKNKYREKIMIDMEELLNDNY